MSSPIIIVTGAFDDVRSRDFRFLEEASKLGRLAVLLWSDQVVARRLGRPPRFPASERLYLLRAIRFCEDVRVVEEAFDDETFAGQLPEWQSATWVFRNSDIAPARAFCGAKTIRCRIIGDQELSGFPSAVPPAAPESGPRRKVVVTGCYDWFHSGHVRFFEEVSAYGDLYVVVGHDANIRSLKGEGHPLFPQEERRYVVGSIRFVKQALVATGDGWLDADPEIQRIKPDIYAVNRDGDRGGKRQYCQQNGIEYLVLDRSPAPGLPRRSSTDLRGF